MLLDPLLKDLDAGCHYVISFADDVVLAFDRVTAGEVEKRANAVLEQVRV